MDEKIFTIKTDTREAVNSVKDLRKGLKELKDAMAGLEEGSEQWSKLAKAAGEYQHQLDAITQSVRGASSDFGDILGNVSKVGAGITGTFQTAAAGLNLIGVESEDVIKSIKTMQNVMAMTQGLASIDAMQKALVKLSATITSTTRTAKLLKTALQPKTFTLIVVAITALVAIWNKFGDSIKKSIPFIGTISDKISEWKKLFTGDDGLNKAIEDAVEKHKQLTNEIQKMETNSKVKKLNKEAAASYKELVESVELYEKKLEDIVAQQQSLDETAPDYKEKWEELNNIGKEYKETIRQIKTEQDKILNNPNSYKEINKEDKSNNKSELDYRIEAVRTQKELAKGTKDEIELSKTLVDLYKQKSSILSGDIDLTKQLTKAQIERNERELEAVKTQREIRNSQREVVQSYYATISATNNLLDIHELILKAINDCKSGYIHFNDIVSLVYNAKVKEQEVFEKTYNLQHKINNEATNELYVYSKLVQENEELLEIVGDLGENSAEYTQALERQVELEDKLRKLVEEYNLLKFKHSKENDLISLAKYQLNIETEKLSRLKQGTIEYERQLEVVTNLRGELVGLTDEYLALQLENKYADNFTSDISYYRERLKLEEAILAETKKGTLEYENQALKVKMLNNQLKASKAAAVTLAANGLGMVSDMLGEIADNQDVTTREGFEKQKNLSYASAVMSALQGITMAISGLFTTKSGPWDIALAAMQAATIAASTAIQINKIAQTQFDSTSSSVNTSSLGSITLVPPTDYSNIVQGASIESNTSNNTYFVSVAEIESVGKRVNVSETESRY